MSTSGRGDQLQDLTSEQRRALLAELLSDKEAVTERRFDLSFAQRRLWFIERLQPNQVGYNLPAAIRLTGALEPDRLRQSLAKVVERQEILRSRFIEQMGEPALQISPTVDVPLPIVDAFAASDNEIGNALNRLLEVPFDLATAPLLRCQLLKLEAQEHVLLVVIHHIIADYASLRILLRDLLAFYSRGAAAKALLPNLEVQYIDFAAWHAGQHELLALELNYWREALADAPTVLELTTDFPRPARQSFIGQRIPFSLAPDLRASIETFAKRAKTTPFVVLLAAFSDLLARYSGQSDICIGTTVDNRERNETRHLVGPFVNNLVFRTHVDEAETFDALVAQAHQTTIGALAHQSVPFEQIVAALDVDRQLAYNALFQVTLVLHPDETQAPTFDFETDGLAVSGVDLSPPGARFDLSLDLTPTATGFSGFFEFRTDLFKPQSIARLGEHLTAYLTTALTNPGLARRAISLTSDAERRRYERWNDTQAPTPAARVHELIARNAETLVGKQAVQAGTLALTYDELETRANQLANHLIARHISSEDTVALLLPRDIDLIVALLAILKTGAHYLPLDPGHPKNRNDRILKDSGASLVLSKGAHEIAAIERIDLDQIGSTLAGESALPPAVPVSGDALAYVIYTSGTTGEPKGVPISHKSLGNLLMSMSKAPGFTADDTLLAVTTIAFDIATLELLLPLTLGGRVVLADTPTSVDGAALLELIESSNATVMQATPATWRILSEAGFAPRENFSVWSGGEALDADLARQLTGMANEVWNLYGPTETTIWSSALKISTTQIADGFVPIGGPIANTCFLIFDDNGGLTPLGVAGELCIGGLGLSAGYFNRPELTNEAFFTYDEGQRFYRSGDRARWLGDGTLQLLGRRDNQVKLRGFRIELGEIEAAVTNEDRVIAAVADLYTPPLGDSRLVLYVQPRAGLIQSKSELTAALRARLTASLPGYMVPTSISILDQLPLNANGKLDRQALPAPSFTTVGTQPLAGSTEQTLATIWSDVLATPVTTSDAEFFAVGGHSLAAARMVARVNDSFGCEMPLATVFEHPRLDALAAWIDSTSKHGSPTLRTTIQKRTPGAAPILSRAQQRQWILATLEPDSPAYNLPAAMRVNGPLKQAPFIQALATLAARHDVLRMSFPDQGGKPGLILDDEAAIPLLWSDASDADDDTLMARLETAARVPFDIGTPPLLRAHVFARGDNDFVVLLLAHHLVVDAQSMERLFTELIESYLAAVEKRPSKLPLLPLTYSDYAAFEAANSTDASITYWQRQLAGAPSRLTIPLDFARGGRPRATGEVRFSIDQKTREALNTISQANGATLFMATLAGFSWLLSRYAEHDDIVIGTPASVRPDPRLENVVGLFVNSLAIRTHLSGSLSFNQLLNHVRESVVGALDHQDAPFEQVVNALDAPREWEHEPIFQTLFVWRNGQARVGSQGQFNFTPLALKPGASKFDLTMTVSDEGDRLEGRLEFRGELFSQQSMADLCAALVSGLSNAAHMPERPLSQISLLSADQQTRLQTMQPRQSDFSSLDCLHHRFEQQAQAKPDAVAIRTSGGSTTYAELDKRASAIAAALAAHGVSAESPVAVCLERSTDLIASLLGILKAGGVYVPLDPAYPTERLKFILDDVDTRLVVTSSALLGLLPIGSRQPLLVEKLHEHRPGSIMSEPHPDNAAYVIYTSGSTGRPKGVAISHRSAVAMADWSASVFDSDELAGVFAGTSVCFDLSVFEIFVPLSLGGAVVLGENALALSDHPYAETVTLLNTVPSAAAELLREGLPSHLRTVNLAGEPLPIDLVNDLYVQSGVDRIYNLYGPSEDTTYSTGALMVLEEKGPSAPIGRALAPGRAYVLDEHLNEVPPGMPGELYLGGPGVARGYLNRPALTAERFIPDPFTARDTPTQGASFLYRTGDRVRLRGDGQLEFLGRFDHQLKLRGFRIEPGEIEAALAKIDGIKDAVVKPWDLARDDSSERLALVAYVATTEPATENHTLAPDSELAREWRHGLAATLPAYMLPSLFVRVTSLPRLPNGKVARDALPAPSVSPNTTPGDTAGPVDAISKALVEIWCSVLGLESVGLADNFFSLGGDSILALQAVAAARDAGIDLEPKDVFEHPTIGELAKVGAALPHVEDVTAHEGLLALTPAQHWFFSLPLEHRDHWNQSVLLSVDFAIDQQALQSAIEFLASQHDSLRASFERSEGGEWQQSIAALAKPIVSIAHESTDAFAVRLEALCAQVQASLSIKDGRIWAAGYFEIETRDRIERRLFITCHHLVIDGVGWRVLLGDLKRVYFSLVETGKPPQLRRPSSLARWLSSLQEHRGRFLDEQDYWQAQEDATIPDLPCDLPDAVNLMASANTLSMSLDEHATSKLLSEVPRSFPIRTEELLITAMLSALHQWTGQSTFRIDMEGHGRGDDLVHGDLSRIIGWLTALYPVRFDWPSSTPAKKALNQIKRTLRGVPNGGMGYGINKYLLGNAGRTDALPQLRFNYLGQVDNLFDEHGFRPAREATGAARHPDNARDSVFEVNAIVARGRLNVHWTYSTGLHTENTISQLILNMHETLNSLIEHCLGGVEDDAYDASDFPQMNFAPGELDELLKHL